MAACRLAWIIESVYSVRRCLGDLANDVARRAGRWVHGLPLPSPKFSTDLEICGLKLRDGMRRRVQADPCTKPESKHWGLVCFPSLMTVPSTGRFDRIQLLLRAGQPRGAGVPTDRPAEPHPPVLPVPDGWRRLGGAARRHHAGEGGETGDLAPPLGDQLRGGNESLTVL